MPSQIPASWASLNSISCAIAWKLPAGSWLHLNFFSSGIDPLGTVTKCFLSGDLRAPSSSAVHSPVTSNSPLHSTIATFFEIIGDGLGAESRNPSWGTSHRALAAQSWRKYYQLKQTEDFTPFSSLSCSGFTAISDVPKEALPPLSYKP